MKYSDPVSKPRWSDTCPMAMNGPPVELFLDNILASGKSLSISDFEDRSSKAPVRQARFCEGKDDEGDKCGVVLPYLGKAKLCCDCSKKAALRKYYLAHARGTN